MDDLERMLIECASAKSCRDCEAYPNCEGVLSMLLKAAKEIGRLRKELEECQR